MQCRHVSIYRRLRDQKVGAAVSIYVGRLRPGGGDAFCPTDVHVQRVPRRAVCPRERQIEVAVPTRQDTMQVNVVLRQRRRAAGHAWWLSTYDQDIGASVAICVTNGYAVRVVVGKRRGDGLLGRRVATV